MDQTTEINFEPKPLLPLLLIIIAVIGALYLYLGRMPLIGWAVVFCSPLIVVGRIAQGKIENPCILLSPRGITDKRLGTGEIAWTDVKRAYMRTFNNVSTIYLELDRADGYFQRQSSARKLVSYLYRLAGKPPFYIDTSHLSCSPDELFRLIRQYGAHTTEKEGIPR